VLPNPNDGQLPNRWQQFVRTGGQGSFRVRTTVVVRAVNSAGRGLGDCNTARMEDRAEQWRLRCQRASLQLASAAGQEVLNAARIAELEAELARERAALDSVVGSHSWKLTEPLRRLRRRRPPALPSVPQAATADLFEARMRAAYEARAASWPQPEPVTFNEKIWHRRLTDRRPVLQTYCDKQDSLEYVARRLPDEVIPHRLGVVDSPEQLYDLELPREYIVKARHGSGGSAVVWDGPHIQGQNWFHPWIRKAFSIDDDPLPRVGEELRDCLSHDYGWHMLEWGYLGRPRQLVVDVLYRGQHGDLPSDLHCYVFGGRVEVLGVATARQRDTTRTSSWQDRNWNLLPIVTAIAHQPQERPADLDDAIGMSEALAGDEPFLRVDWLLTSEGLKFGELTPYSHAGCAMFTTQWADEFLGSFWTGEEPRGG